MVPPRHYSVPEAYSTLGIDQVYLIYILSHVFDIRLTKGSSLDVVKSAYKKVR